MRKDKKHGRQKGKIPSSQKKCRSEIEGETQTEAETKTDESCRCESEIKIDEETRRGRQKGPQSQNSWTSRLNRGRFLRAPRIGRQVRRTIGRHPRYFRGCADGLGKRGRTSGRRAVVRSGSCGRGGECSGTRRVRGAYQRSAGRRRARG